MNAVTAWNRNLVLGARQAAQWRLLLLWLLALALPLLLTLLPLTVAVAGQLDHSLLGPRLLDSFDLPALADVAAGVRQQGFAPAALLCGVLVFVLLLPWLTGTAMASARAPQRLGFAALLKGGLDEYGRMARLWLWALLPLGAAAGIGTGLQHVATEQGLTMTLEADAVHLGQAALALGALLLLLAHATVDAARAQLVLEPRRRSVIAAWWRATKRLLRRPGQVLLYLAMTAIGLLLAALLGWLRVQLAPVGPLSFLAVLLLGQALVLVLVWMRCARLFALVAAARA